MLWTIKSGFFSSLSTSAGQEREKIMTTLPSEYILTANVQSSATLNPFRGNCRTEEEVMSLLAATKPFWKTYSITLCTTP
jgi:hypothetical protein